MAAREFLVLSATEPDRTGLLAELTGFIADCGCNVEDSRLVVLGGYAGIMVMLSGLPDQLQAVTEGLEELRTRTGIRGVPRLVRSRQAQPSAPVSRLEVQASAIDHEGIIHALAETVRRQGGNIVELESATEAAPMSGEPLFRLRMMVWSPGGEGPGDALWRALEQVAREEHVELEVRSAPAGSAPVPAGAERRAAVREG